MDDLDTLRTRVPDLYGAELLTVLGTDPVKWAAAFCTLAKRDDHYADEEWVFWWFVEHANAVRASG